MLRSHAVSLLARARALFQSPADRRLAAAAAEAWSGQPSPVRASAGPALSPWAPQTGPRPPAINWQLDQPDPPPSRTPFVPGHSDHVYRNFAAPIAFEGWDLARIDNAIAMMRIGWFTEASSLLVACMGFAPLLSALQQAVAPILALRRDIRGGDKGTAREIAGMLRAALCPDGGLMPSIYFPPDAWGTLAIYLRMYGFAVLQHVDGDRDPVTGIRPRFTRIWEPWAVQLQRNPRKRLAYTSEAVVEIRNDGEFTFVADEQEPHHTGALVALGQEVYGGKLTQDARNRWLDFFGDPKLFGILPPKVATGGDAGDAFEAAVEAIYQPGGRGIIPNQSDIKAVSISGEGSQSFRDALVDRIIHVFLVLTGTMSTIGSGGPSNSGPYQPAKGGPWNVRHDLVARPTVAIVRAFNQGHIAPFLDRNFSAAIEEAKRAGEWVDPVLEIPIVSPDRDERIRGEIERHKALVDQVKAEKDVGADVTNDRVRELASTFEAKPFTLAAQPPGQTSFGYDQEGGVVTINDRLAELGKPPAADDRGEMTIPEYKARLQMKIDREKAEAEAAADASAAPPADAPAPAQGAPENASAPTS